MRVLGLMSGTSADGVDAVLASFHGPLRRPRWQIHGRASVAYPAPLRDQIVAVGQGQPTTAGHLLELGEALTDVQAEAALACDPEGSAERVGCHGQTLWHRPPSPERAGNSWQLLHAQRLAHRLGRPVVFDFRAADLALGGQGAPLVPAADAALLPPLGGWRGSGGSYFAILAYFYATNSAKLCKVHAPEAYFNDILAWKNAGTFCRPPS